jgi:hypothetical protein
MVNEFRIDSAGIVITRARKIIQMYDIDFPLAHKDIDWNRQHHVPYCETRLIVYLIGGKELAEKFSEWADEVEKARRM